MANEAALLYKESKSLLDSGKSTEAISSFKRVIDNPDGR